MAQIVLLTGVFFGMVRNEGINIRDARSQHASSTVGIHQRFPHRRGSIMKNITIAQRIVLMIFTAVLALLLIGTVGLNVASKGTASIREINDVTLKSIKSLAALQRATR